MDAPDRVAEIERRLVQSFSPESLHVEDEGHLHVGHEGAKDGRGHFRVSIVSGKFDDMPVIARHRAIYQALGELMQTDIHALSIDAVSSKEL